MSWTEPDNPWHIAQHRRYRRVQFFAYGVIVVYALALGGLVLLGGDLTRSGPTDLGRDFGWFRMMMVVLPIVLFAMFLVCAIMMVRIVRSEHRVLTTVPELDGQVCMKCRIPLSGGPSARRCSRCRLEVAHDKVRAYWEQYPHQAGSLAFQRAALDDLIRPPGRTGFRVRSWKWIQDHRALYWTASTVVIGAIVLVPAIMDGRAILPTLIAASTYLVPLIGFFLCLPSSSKRVGTSRHCPKCEYEQVAGDTGPNCPECGTPWRGRGATIKGRLVRAPRRQLIGTAILLICAGLFARSMWTGRSTVASLTPTPLLVQQAAQVGWRSHEAWKAVAQRKLTADQERRLLSGLIETRLQGELIPAPSRAWLQAILTSGTAPSDLVDRFHGESVTVRIVAPSDVRAGRSNELTVEFTTVDRYFTPVGSSLILVEGVTIGNASRFVGNGHKAVAALRQGEIAKNDGRFLRRLRFTPPESGDTTVRVAYWQMTAPYKVVGHEFAWNEDGTPILPAAVIWSRRIVLELPIHVAPAAE